MSASRSTLYGAGVFTTIRIIGGAPWLWEKHWRRLQNDAAKLGIDMSAYSDYMLRRGVDENIPDDEKGVSQKLRITVADERSSPLWSGAEPPIPTSVSFLGAPLTRPRRPFRLGVSPHRINSTSPVAGLKTCNYLDQTMSLDEANSRDLNEAIRVNERGRVTSACMANVFWLKNGQLLTPALSTGCLPGTTREFVMENLDVTEVEAEIDEFDSSDAVFLTSAGLGVVQVDEFDGRAMPDIDPAILNIIPS